MTAGCGLDVISVVLDDSISTGKIPDTSYDFDECSFVFSTHKIDDKNSMGNNYVAYKIYNNKSTLDSEVNALNRLVDDATKKQNSAVSLFNTYYYRSLYIKSAADEKEGKQFELDNAYHSVRIRLTNYDDTSDDYVNETFPLMVTRPPSQASFATVRRLMMRETFRYLSRRICFAPLLLSGKREYSVQSAKNRAI